MPSSARRAHLRRVGLTVAVVLLVVGAPAVYLVVRPPSSWAAAPAADFGVPASSVPRMTFDDVPDRQLARAEMRGTAKAGPATRAAAPASVAEAPVGNLIGFPVSDHTPSSGFGYRSDPFTHLPRFHAGVDLGQPCLEPAWASLDGVVIGAGMAGGYGNRVVLKHADLDGKSFATTYNHMTSIAVRMGQHVKRGDVVGRIGSTGRSTACHMHFEVIVAGSYVDPMPYLTGQKSTAKLTRPVGSYMPSGTYTTTTKTPSATPTASATPTTKSPSPTVTPSSKSPSPTASATSASATPSHSASPTPSETSKSPTASPSPKPAESPSPTSSPTQTKSSPPETTRPPSSDPPPSDPPSSEPAKPEPDPSTPTSSASEG